MNLQNFCRTIAYVSCVAAYRDSKFGQALAGCLSYRVCVYPLSLVIIQSFCARQTSTEIQKKKKNFCLKLKIYVIISFLAASQISKKHFYRQIVLSRQTLTASLLEPFGTIAFFGVSLEAVISREFRLTELTSIMIV